MTVTSSDHADTAPPERPADRPRAAEISPERRRLRPAGHRREPARCATSPRCGTSSAPTRCRSTSSVRHLQPARPRPLGAQLLLHHLLRRLGRRAPAGVHPEAQALHRVQSGEEINNWLLDNAEVRADIARPGHAGVRPKIAMVFFDEETERICEELGYDLILPSAELREHLDSKLVTTRLGNEVGVPSVPNVLITVEELDGAVDAATDGRARAPIWSSRRRTATRARPRSSSTSRPTGSKHARTSSATRSR